MAKRARRVTRKPDAVRLSKPLNRDSLEANYAKLKQVRVKHGRPEDQDTDTLCALFVSIRSKRNVVTGVVERLFPRIGSLRADLTRLQAVIDAEGAEILRNGGVSGYKTAPERNAALRVMLREWHEARDEVKADLQECEALMNHAKWIRDELRNAFEETSRILASIELEKRLER